MPPTGAGPQDGGANATLPLRGGKDCAAEAALDNIREAGDIVAHRRG